MKALLKAGANLNKSTDFGVTPLYAASARGYTSIVNVLLLAGAEIDKQAIDYSTPLMAASKFGEASIVKTLLIAGADLTRADNIGSTPLHIAQRALGTPGQLITIDLLDTGAEIDAQNGVGVTPLMLAAFFGNVGTSRILLERGADRTIRDNYELSALDIVCKCQPIDEDLRFECPIGGCDQSGTIQRIRDLLT